MSIFHPNTPRRPPRTLGYDGPLARHLARTRQELVIPAKEVQAGDEMLFLDRYEEVRSVEPGDEEVVIWFVGLDVVITADFRVNVRRPLTT